MSELIRVLIADDHLIVREGLRLILEAEPGSLCAPAGGTGPEPGFPAIPIPMQPDAVPVPEFIGGPANPKVISAQPIPEHPFMAPNGASNIHMDAYMSDTYRTSGPLGQSPTVKSSFLTGECGTTTFDGMGRIISVCLGPFTTRLYLIDPESLDTLATMKLPARPVFLSNGFGAGGYFFLDEQERAVIPTATREIWVVEVDDSGFRPVFRKVASHDLTGTVPEDQSIVSVLPDAQGLLWFVTSGGIVGTLAPGSGSVRATTLPGNPPETISKSFAVDPDPGRGGVFIVSDYALYRFDAQAAIEAGLINRVVAPDELQKETDALAVRLAQGPTIAYARTKALLNGSIQSTLEEQLAAETQAFVDCAVTEDFAEGVTAFAEKRPARFTGK